MATPYADYKVAAVNENWMPLAGVEIEAMNLATLLADAIATTGLDGVASFSGLPAGPHFFRVRATRVSTKVGHRTYIGQIHLQVIAMGHQGIVKDAIVDKNGHGTHTTIQAAINSVLASGGSGYYVIHINPGLYQELLTVAFGVSGDSLILEAQGEVKNLPGRTYNKVVRISQPAGQGTQNTLTLTGTGGLELRGLDIGSDISGHAVKVTGTAASLLVRDCDLHSVGGQAIQATINIAVLDSIIASDSSVAFGSAAGAATWLFSRCAIIGAPAISGDFNELAFDDCWLNFAGASSNYTIQESNLVVSQRLRMTGCNIAAGTLGGIYFGNASGNVSQDLIFVGNYIYGSGKAGTQKGITLVCVKGAVIVGNKFRSLGYGIYLMPVGGVTVQGLIVDGNSFDSVGVAIHADAGAMDTTDIIGPNAFQDVTTPYEGVPGSSLYTSHTLLDGVYHTDTLLGNVVDGDTIIGNVTPKWSRLAISIPAANVRNVLGIDNAELRPSWKTALDGTTPADIAAVGAAGTSLVFSHRDHVHAHPVFGSGDLHPEYLTPAEAGALYELIGVAAGLIATHAALPDVHHAGFIGLTIAGPANIDPGAGDRITFVDSATVTWDSPAANQIRATGAGGGGAHALLSATHTDTLPAAVADGSIIIGNVTPAWSSLAISIPAATFINVLGVANAELRPSWKALFDATVPTTIAPSDAAATGAAVTAARRDHLHGAPATFPATAHDLDGASHTGVADYTSILGLASLTIADANFGLALSGADPRITVDVGDYLGYIRASNYFSFVPGTVEALQVGATFLRTVGYTCVGSLSAPANTTAGDFSAVRAYIGEAGVAFPTGVIFRAGPSGVLTPPDASTSMADFTVAYYADGTTANRLRRAMIGTCSVVPTAADSGQFIGMAFAVDHSSGAFNLTSTTGGMRGLSLTLNHNVASDLYRGIGIEVVVIVASSGTAGLIRGYATRMVYSGAGAITSTTHFNATVQSWPTSLGTHTGLQINNMGNAVVTNAYAIDISAQSAAVLNVGIRLADCTQGGIWFNSDTASVAAGIVWGTARDTNLYRSSVTAGYVKTDGGIVSTLLTYLGIKTLTANNQADVRLFAQENSAIAQTGAFYNKLQIFGGSGESRDLELYQVNSGNAFIDSTVGSLNLRTTSSNANILLTPNGSGVAQVSTSLLVTTYERVGSLTAPTNVTAGDLTCIRLFVGDAAAVAGKEALITGDMQITGTLVIGTAPDYTVTNVTTDRTFDANATTLDEVADILGTLIADLTTMGLLQ